MSRFAVTLLPLLAFAFPVELQAASVDARVRDPSGKPVADAVLYALPVPGMPDTRPRRTVAVEQVDREFVPYVSVVQAGTTVTFPNHDPILHHVYSFSPAKSFEIKLYTGKAPSGILFDKPGVVTLGCNIHDWMIAYILVVPTAYFAKTDEGGVARLRDVPAGAYELRLWHPQQRKAPDARSVSLESSTAHRADFELEVLARRAKYKPPLDRLKY